MSFAVKQPANLLSTHMKFYLISLCLLGIILPIQNAYSQQNSNRPQFLKMQSDKGFILPIDCAIGTDCWIMNYMDYTPDDGQNTDAACQKRTYDGHKGTDFAILDGTTMEQGVNVLAAQDGKVSKIRDGDMDIWADEAQLQAIKDARKECGNAVMITHENDVQTIYCHLKKDSITAKANQRVKAGDKIAQVGLSGHTQFPHVTFMVMKNNKVIDPFTGQSNNKSCGKIKSSLWNKNLKLQYQPFDIQSLEFSNTIPTLDDLDKNTNLSDAIKISDNKIILWGTILGVQKNDIITLEITDPNGKEFLKQETIQDKDRIRQLYYIGKTVEKYDVIEGAYTAKITYTRKQEGRDDIVKSKFKAALITK